jgi:hypothetical protein
MIPLVALTLGWRTTGDEEDGGSGEKDSGRGKDEEEDAAAEGRCSSR